MRAVQGQDRQSRDVVALVGSIRDKMPLAPQFMGRRMALEQVAAQLAGAPLTPLDQHRVLPADPWRPVGRCTIMG